MKKLLPLLLPAAVLALAACSSEPSDWRPDKKVSLDMIPPGTRPSDNFDLTPETAPAESKGGAIPRPIDSGTRYGHDKSMNPAQVMTADTQEGTAQPKEEQDASKRANGTEPTPNGKAGQPEASQQGVQGSNQAGSPDMKK